MALQVWLPLDGDLRNLGTEPVTVTSADTTIDNNGILGKAIHTTGTGNSGIFFTTTDNIRQAINTPNFTIAMWVYCQDGDRGIVFGDYGVAGSISFNLEWYYGRQFRFYWAGIPDIAINDFYEQNKWVHMAITVSSTGFKLYKNGVLFNTYTGEISSKNKTSGNFQIGKDGRNDNTMCIGSFNDFRFYNECLSEKQIKEISKALVLHYMLNDYNGYNTQIPIANLPSEYQEVEYIESHGDEHINTGYIPTANSSVIAKCCFVTFVGNTGPLIGAGSTGNSRFFVIAEQNGGNPMRITYGSHDININYQANEILNITFNMPQSKAKINGKEYSFNGTYTSGNKPIYLFGTSGYSNNLYHTIGRIYYTRFYTNATLQRNFIPCYRKTDKKPGLYDLVTSTFYTNASGTGEFDCGPLVKLLPNTYNALEFLDSNTGVNYINSGVPRANNKIYRMVYEANWANTTNRQCFGANGYTYAGVVDGYFQLGDSGNGHTDNIVATPKTWHRLDVTYDAINNKYKYIINNTYQNIRNYSFSTPDLNFYLFRLTQGDQQCNCKCKYFQVYENHILLRDMRPALRISDSVPGMYDLVNDVFYPNNGTGTFTYGEISKVIYDASGYCHNGHALKVPIYSSITPRYQSCIYMINSLQEYIITDGTVGCSNRAMTRSIWYRTTNGRTVDSAAGYHHLFCSYPLGEHHEMAVHKDGYTRCGIHITNSSNQDSRQVWNDSAPVTSNTWHQITLVYNGTSWIKYFDGQQQSSHDCPGTITTPITQWIIGVYGGATTYHSDHIYYSDARIYATALSAADVKELYETSMVVDSNGNILPRVLST